MADPRWLACVRAGFGAVRVLWRVVLLVWGAFFALAWVASLPAWRWWDRVLAYAPEGDRLLDGLNLPLLHELFQYDRSPTTAIAIGSVSTFVLIAIAINPFMAGGVLGVLRDDDTSRVGVTRRFVNDGVRFYWRFARVLLTIGTLGTMAALFLMLALAGGAQELDTNGYERAGLWVGDAALLVALAMFGVTSLVIDLARVHIVRADEPRAVMGVAHGVAFFRQHAGALFGVAAVFLVLFAVAVVFYVLGSSSVTPRTWPLIFLLMAWQQLFSIVRTALRVAMLGAVVTLVERRSPVPLLSPMATPDAEPPLSDLPPLG